MVCDWVHASFNATTPHLQLLLIIGHGYWWNLDFATLLSLTIHHNRYMLVMIEQFSKWIELVPLQDKSSERVPCAFLDQVLSRFGAPTKCSWIRKWNPKDNFKNCVSKLWSTIGLLFVIILKLMAWLKECTYGEERFMKMWVKKRHIGDWDM
jgi:hypothetical protein